MEPIFIISIFTVVILLLLIMGAPIKSLRFIGQGVVKVLIGVLLLFFLNTFGGALGLHIPINIFTAGISGLLGIPGIISLIIIKLFII